MSQPPSDEEEIFCRALEIPDATDRAAYLDRACDPARVMDSVRIRRARPDDLDFLVELFAHDEVEPFLAAVRAKDRESVAAEIVANRLRSRPAEP